MGSQNDAGHYFPPKEISIYLSYHDIIGNIFLGQVKSKIDKNCWALNLEPGLLAPFLTPTSIAS